MLVSKKCNASRSSCPDAAGAPVGSGEGSCCAVIAWGKIQQIHPAQVSRQTPHLVNRGDRDPEPAWVGRGDTMIDPNSTRRRRQAKVACSIPNKGYRQERTHSL